MAWLDNSGLYQKYGLEQTTVQAGGEYRTHAELREIEIKVDLTTVTATPTVISGADNIFFPAGVCIEEVTTVAQTAGVTGVSIDLGLIRTDRTTEIDYNGILAAAPLADHDAINERKTYTIGVTGVGALMTAGTTGANSGYLTINSTATLYTAGILVIRIKYRKP